MKKMITPAAIFLLAASYQWATHHNFKVAVLMLIAALIQISLWRPKPQSFMGFNFSVLGLIFLLIPIVHMVSPTSTNAKHYIQECHGLAVLSVIGSVILAITRRIGIACSSFNVRVKLIFHWIIVVTAGAVGFYIFNAWLSHPKAYQQDGLEILVFGFWFGLLSIASMMDAYALGKSKNATDVAEELLKP